MRINWYNSRNVVCVAWIGPFHFNVRRWHDGEDFTVEIIGKFAPEFLASFPPNCKREEINRFMVKYAHLKVQAWEKELGTWLSDEIQNLANSAG